MRKKVINLENTLKKENKKKRNGFKTIAMKIFITHTKLLLTNMIKLQIELIFI